MDHQSSRFQIPGIIFITPIYIMACWLSTGKDTSNEIRQFILVGGIGTFAFISIPVGWWMYNAYRVWWIILTRGGYQKKKFVKMIRKNTKPFYLPTLKSFLVDLSHIKGIDKWICVKTSIFRKAFYPFVPKRDFKKKIRKENVSLEFAEPLSDYVLWKDAGYDYARSISSVRYSLESSLFALVLGIIYAFGLKAFWERLWIKEAKTGSTEFVAWIIVVSLLTLFFLITLGIRWYQVSKEYDARLILTTMISSDPGKFDITSFEPDIPTPIINKLKELNLPANPVAAFDLDNTLLIDDIGEAVFALLLKKEKITGFNWADYQQLITTDRETAYKRVIEAMNNTPLKTVEEITEEIINSSDEYIEINSIKVPVPKPNKTMQSLIFLLRSMGIEINVVTASNEVSARIICWKYFGIPASNVYGGKLITRNKRVFFDGGEIPYSHGKVNVLLKKGKGRPVITGGDGIWDKPLLDHTAPGGIKLWVGKSISEFKELQKDHYGEQDFFQI